MIKSVMLYDCETWRLTERSKRTLKATEMDRYSAIYEDFKKREGQERRNQTMMVIERSIIDDIERKQLV